MIQLNNREKRFIIIGIIIIVVSLAYARFFYPMYIAINALVDEFREKQTVLRDLEDIQTKVKRLEGKIDNSLKSLEEVEQSIPYGKNIHKLLLDLETLLNKHDLKQHAFAPQDAEAMETYYILPINIRVSGKFEDIIGFLRDWENYQRLVNITEAKLYPDEEKDSNIVGEFVANIYIFKTEEGFVENFEGFTFEGDTGRLDPFAPI